jgi:prepilin-type N-terminal cleavage/methylation domain-containing protein
MSPTDRRDPPPAASGFTLVELMIVVVVLGVLAAIAIPLYMRFVRQSKAGEAEINLGKIAQLVEQQYARSGNEKTSAAITPGSTALISRLPGTSRTPAASCGGAPAANGESVPRTATLVTGRSYQPAIQEWNCSSPGAGCTLDTVWSQLKFEISSPIRYVYCYESTVPDSGPQSFVVVASGDVDGDGVWSRYERRGQADAGGTITIGSVAVTNGDE